VRERKISEVGEYKGKSPRKGVGSSRYSLYILFRTRISWAKGTEGGTGKIRDKGKGCFQPRGGVNHRADDHGFMRGKGEGRGWNGGTL